MDDSGPRVWEGGTGSSECKHSWRKNGAVCFNGKDPSRVWEGMREGRKIKDKKGLLSRKHNMWLKSIWPKLMWFEMGWNYLNIQKGIGEVK